MSTDLAEFRAYLDGLYAAVADAAPRRAALVSAALKVIYTAAKSDADLEVAFRHLVADAGAEVGPSVRMTSGLPIDIVREPGVPTYVAPVANPNLHAALTRDGG